MPKFMVTNEGWDEQRWEADIIVSAKAGTKSTDDVRRAVLEEFGVHKTSITDFFKFDQGTIRPTFLIKFVDNDQLDKMFGRKPYWKERTQIVSHKPEKVFIKIGEYDVEVLRLHPHTHDCYLYSFDKEGCPEFIFS